MDMKPCMATLNEVGANGSLGMPMDSTVDPQGADSNIFVFTLDRQLMESFRLPYVVTYQMCKRLARETTFEIVSEGQAASGSGMAAVSGSGMAVDSGGYMVVDKPDQHQKWKGSAGRKVRKLGACRVLGCETMLESSTNYGKRHRICDMHLKSLEVPWEGKIQRFCQKCTRFQELIQFDGSRHSCRKELTLQRNRRLDAGKASQCQYKSVNYMTSASTKNTATYNADSFLNASSSQELAGILDNEMFTQVKEEYQSALLREGGHIPINISSSNSATMSLKANKMALVHARSAAEDMHTVFGHPQHHPQSAGHDEGEGQ